MNISASVNHSGDVATVVVSGEVDIATGPTVEQAIREAMASEGVAAIVVDLSAVRFLDSSGISLLLRTRRLADEQGVACRVTGAHGTVLRVLELSGVWRHLCGDSNETTRS